VVSEFLGEFNIVRFSGAAAKTEGFS